MQARLDIRLFDLPQTEQYGPLAHIHGVGGHRNQNRHDDNKNTDNPDIH